MQGEKLQYELSQIKPNSRSGTSSLEEEIIQKEMSLSYEKLSQQSNNAENQVFSLQGQEQVQSQYQQQFNPQMKQAQSTENIQNEMQQFQVNPSNMPLYPTLDQINQNQQLQVQVVTKQLGEPVLQCQNLYKVYKLQNEEISALKDISLSPNCEFQPIRRGEFVIIRGPSGGGKTTLLNMLGTIDKPTSGKIQILNQEITENATDKYLSQLRMLHIGFVFQSFNLLATMTALENVELPMMLANQMSEKKRKERAKELLAKVNMKDRTNHLPSELSGGEKQRVAIARALSNSPQILLLDEPTGDLDTTNTIEIMDLLLEINKATTIVMVTHNPDLECYADRILYVEDGQFSCQAINTSQHKLNLEKYLRYLNAKYNN